MMDILTGIPDSILSVAKQKAFQYALDDMNGEVKPVITIAFLGRLGNTL